MRYPNAAMGVKKLYAAELVAALAAILIAVGTVLGAIFGIGVGGANELSGAVANAVVLAP